MRCDDCLDEIGPDAERFAVLKERTLTADEAEAVSAEPSMAALLKWHQTFVCSACAGWHRDALGLTADEAGA